MRIMTVRYCRRLAVVAAIIGASFGAWPAAAQTAAKPATAHAPMGNAVFPSAISPKYAKEKAGEARMHTCLDQYHANKASNANGGMPWIQSGDGYYSVCNKKLKS
jgi:hypothetical protein